MPIQLHTGNNYGSMARLYIGRESVLRSLVSINSLSTAEISQANFAAQFTKIPFLQGDSGFQYQAAPSNHGKSFIINIGVKLKGNPSGNDEWLDTAGDFKLWAIAYDYQGRSYFIGQKNEGLRLVESFDMGSKVLDALGWDYRFSGEFSSKIRQITIIP